MKSIFDDDHHQVIVRLKKARLAKDYSQNELAEKLGVSQSYVSKIEQGQIRLDIVQLKRITKVLGIDLKDIV